MPIFSSQLGKIESQTPQEGIKVLANHLRKIQEELEYRLMNLDSTNVTEINTDNTTMSGKLVQLISENERGIAKLEVTADEILTEVSKEFESLSGKLSEYSTIQQTADAIATAVKSVTETTNGKLENYSTIQQTADAITSAVQSVTEATGETLKSYSTVTQTSEAITAAVSNLNASTILRLDPTGVYIVDSNGKQVSIQGGQINAEGLKVNAANITGTLAVGRIPDSIARTSQLITESEVTTITNNAISTANISASRITTGSLNAGNLSMKGLLKVCDANGLIYGYIGATDIGTTSGSVLTGPNQQHGCMATNTGAKLTYGVNEHMIWVAEDGCSSSSAMKVFSDRRLKEDICYELEDAETMFKLLRPCSFHMIQDKNHKKSWGFVAQEAISAAEEAGMDAEKLAMFGSYEGMHTIAYGEMTALNTHMIQKLMERVAALEEAKA